MVYVINYKYNILILTHDGHQLINAIFPAQKVTKHICIYLVSSSNLQLPKLTYLKYALFNTHVSINQLG